jgi:hypothetical protein
MPQAVHAQSACYRRYPSYGDLRQALAQEQRSQRSVVTLRNRSLSQPTKHSQRPVDRVSYCRNIFPLAGVHTDMKPAQLMQMIAAPMASLFLTLSLCVAGIGSRTPAGIRFPLLRMRASHSGLCGDDRVVVVSLRQGGDLKINQNRITWDALAPTIARIMQYRAERVIYVLPYSEISYTEFANLMDKVAGSTTDLHIALLSGNLRRTMKEHRFDTCDLDWPQSEFD